jgi:hypothetical protein
MSASIDYCRKADRRKTTQPSRRSSSTKLSQSGPSDLLQLVGSRPFPRVLRSNYAPGRGHESLPVLASGFGLIEQLRCRHRGPDVQTRMADGEGWAAWEKARKAFEAMQQG